MEVISLHLITETKEDYGPGIHEVLKRSLLMNEVEGVDTVRDG